MLPRENARFADVLARFPRQLHLVLLVLTPRPPSSMLIINVAFQERRHLAALGTAALAHPRPVRVFHQNDHMELPLANVAPALDSILAVNLFCLLKSELDGALAVTVRVRHRDENNRGRDAGC